MKRYKRVAVLLAVLALACAATFAVSRYEQHKEQIAESGETVLAIDPDAVTALSWTVGDESLAFHKDESWLYDADEAFPADADKIGERLELFSDFAAAFVIEDVEDYAQYGLDDPAATITLTAGEQNYTIKLGDFSQMDEQRYVDTGDGNVYLAVTDPMDLFDVELGELIQNDVIPDFDAVSRIAFAGAENYTVTYEKDSGRSYAAEDVYFDENGRPLDTARVEAYLSALSGADLSAYATYNASAGELEAMGMNDPELTVTVDYTGGDDGETAGSCTVSIARAPGDRATPDTAAPDDESTDDEAEDITAYLRVGESQIIYELPGGLRRPAPPGAVLGRLGRRDRRGRHAGRRNARPHRQRHGRGPRVEPERHTGRHDRRDRSAQRADGGALYRRPRRRAGGACADAAPR